MKNRLVLLSALLAALFSAAPLQAQNLILSLQTGAEQTVPLNNLQKITFSGGNLVLNFVTGGTQSYGFSQLAKLSFSPTVALDRPVQSSSTIFYNSNDNRLYFRNFDDREGTVSIYRLDGRLALRKTLLPDETIDMSGFPSSIYLVHLGHQVLKFKK